MFEKSEREGKKRRFSVVAVKGVRTQVTLNVFEKGKFLGKNEYRSNMAI